MTSKTVAALIADLEVIRSHSQPRASNDNPHSDYVELVIIPSGAVRRMFCLVTRLLPGDRFGIIQRLWRKASRGSGGL
jgi:hypothetical protein